MRGAGAAIILCILSLQPTGAVAQADLVPVFSIWDVKLGQPVTQIPAAKVSLIDCGTNGGPAAAPLTTFADFAQCPPEPSGLHEVSFTYDDEQDYIARALELEYKFLQGGTSAFAHPIVPSVLVDNAGVVQGIRIVTDDRAHDTVRRTAVTMGVNLKARYNDLGLTCADIPPKDGELPVGDQFIHELCTTTSKDGTVHFLIERSYLRKKGQKGLSTDTQAVNQGYYQSQTRFEEVLAPYTPASAP